MKDFERILANIQAGFHNQQIVAHDIIAVLLMVTVLSVYEFLVYRYISKRSFYSKQFNISLALLPFFIATIIMALQSNLIITLGTIGAGHHPVPYGDQGPHRYGVSPVVHTYRDHLRHGPV